MLVLILFVILLIYLGIRIIQPLRYWKKRGVFYVNPLTRLRQLFFHDKSLAEHIRLGYEEFPNKRYYGSYQFLKPSLFVRDLDLIKQLTVKDFEHFTDHIDFLRGDGDSIFSKNLFTMKGREWRELRTTLSPAFTSAKMKAMFVLISEAARKFAEHFEDLNQDVIEVEMKEAYSKFTNDVIATCAFGISCDSLKDPSNEFFAMGRLFTATSPLRMLRALLFGFFPKLFSLLRIPAFPEKVVTFFKRIITDTISLREKEGIIRPDLIHLLMEAKKGKLSHEIHPSVTNDTGFATVEEIRDSKTKSTLEISDDLITAQALIFFFAGFETSSSLLSFLSYELAKNSDIQQKLLQEIDENLPSSEATISYEKIAELKYLDQVVSEALRKWTPGFGLNRVCTRDYTIEPKQEGELPLTISKGCFLMIPVTGIHFDPKYFENPEMFDPERFSEENKGNIVPGSYLPFGIGPRNCIGSRFALLEIKAVIVAVLRKFEFQFIEKTPVPIKLMKSFSMVVKGGLWLGLKRRL